MKYELNRSANSQRDEALLILDANLAQLSRIFGECYNEMGRGAMLVYASDVIKGRLPNKYDYRTKDEILDVFDDKDSRASLEEMIDKYDHLKEGIMTLITSYSNATFFLTVLLR